MGRGEDADGTRGPRSKVERLIEEYGLDGFGERLEREWTGEGEEHRSLRELADVFNRRLLRAALADAGETPLAGEVANTYRLLAGDDASSGEQVQARSALERAGVDVEKIESDFVSHQAVHTYLTKHRGAKRAEPTGDDRVSRGAETVERLKSRLGTVTRKTLDGLRDAGHVALGSFDVVVKVQVFCRDCGTRREVRDLLDRGGCDCEQN